ncbi:hypothetical protein J6590_075316 [Homalodisca vitripennis]|nr:hypothetical protein J6590_075316 [Homalodisca vitripennis]
MYITLSFERNRRTSRADTTHSLCASLETIWKFSECLRRGGEALDSSCLTYTLSSYDTQPVRLVRNYLEILRVFEESCLTYTLSSYDTQPVRLVRNYLEILRDFEERWRGTRLELSHLHTKLLRHTACAPRREALDSSCLTYTLSSYDTQPVRLVRNYLEILRVLEESCLTYTLSSYDTQPVRIVRNYLEILRVLEERWRGTRLELSHLHTKQLRHTACAPLTTHSLCASLGTIWKFSEFLRRGGDALDSSCLTYTLSSYDTQPVRLRRGGEALDSSCLTYTLSSYDTQPVRLVRNYLEILRVFEERWRGTRLELSHLHTKQLRHTACAPQCLRRGGEALDSSCLTYTLSSYDTQPVRLVRNYLEILRVFEERWRGTRLELSHLHTKQLRHTACAPR